MKTQSLHLVFMLCLLASLCNAQLPSYLPTNGLVAWYPFNSNANDESGNANNGAVNGAVLTTDRFSNSNSAYDFNGVNNEILIEHNNILNTLPITASCWFKSNTPQQNKMLINKYVCQSYNGYSFQLTVNRPSAFYFSNLSSHYFDNPLGDDSYDFNDDIWHHALWIINENEIKIYCDGVIIYYGNSSGNLASTTTNAPLRFGSYAQGICAGSPQNFYYKGQIDDISIYNRALTQAEVTALYTATATNTGGGTTSTTTAPPGIPYQAEVRNENGEVLANANVNVRFTLHELVANGTISYQESHALITNELGLFAATIGAGTAVQGTFASINWAQTTKFLQVEVDTGSGWITMGNQQLMSVPYALYAANGPVGPVGPQGPAGADGQPGPQGPQGPQGLNGSSSNLIFGAHNISYNSELNLSQNGITIINESGVSSWGGGGVTFTVPPGKIWKIAGYAAGNNVIGIYNVGETWLDEGESISFEGNGGSLASVPFKFTAFQYTKSGFDFNVVTEQGFSSWGGDGVAFTVPVGKVWKIVGYSAGNGVFGVYNIGETWLDEGQTISFEGNGGSLASVPFKFTAFEYTK